MKCQELRLLIDDYIDCTLSSQETNLCDEHIAICDQCADAVALAGSLDEAAQSVYGLVKPQTDLWPEVQRRIQSRKSQRKTNWLSAISGNFWQPALLTGSVAMVAVVALMVPVSFNKTAQRVYAPAEQSISYGSVYQAGHESFAADQGTMADGTSKVVLAAFASREASTEDGPHSHIDTYGGDDNLQ